MIIVFFLMIPRPPISTLTDTLVPYTTLFRSRLRPDHGRYRLCRKRRRRPHPRCRSRSLCIQTHLRDEIYRDRGGIVQGPRSSLNASAAKFDESDGVLFRLAGTDQVPVNAVRVGCLRSEERRVGKECVSTCRSRWSPVH